MNDAEIKVLLRSALELYHRSACVKKHLVEIQRAGHSEYDQLIATIQDALNQVEKPPLESIESDLSPSDLARVLRKQLKTFSHWFAAAHEILVYLPTQGVLPESVDLLKNGFSKTYADISPSVILGTLFNAFQFDFHETLGRVLPDFGQLRPPDEHNVVLQLPVCDRLSPTGWAILAHEMGHAIDRTKSISSNAADSLVADKNSRLYKIVSNWAKEFCADLIAVRVFGPAIAHSLLSIEYCVHPLRPIHQASESHPPTKWRLETISQYLNAQYGENCLEAEEERYKEAFDFSLRTHVQKEEDQESLLAQHQIYVDHIVKPLTADIQKEIDKHIDHRPEIQRNRLERCVKRLKNGLPIGSQGMGRQHLRERIVEYRSKVNESSDNCQLQFVELLKEFQEDPVPVSQLLLSCSARRFEIIDEAISGDVKELANWDRIQHICEHIDRINRLTVKSISTSMIHARLNEKTSTSPTITEGA